MISNSNGSHPHSLFCDCTECENKWRKIEASSEPVDDNDTDVESEKDEDLHFEVLHNFGW